MDELLVKEQQGILVITLNRPEKHNCLNGNLLAALHQVFLDAKTNPTIKALLLKGEGKSFCAGADINRLAECDAQSGYEFAKYGQAVFAELEHLGKPSLAALHGHVLGGGCELAMAANLRMAHAATLMGQPEVKLGVIPGYGGTQRLTRLVGVARAIDLCISGRIIDAKTACDWGLVNWVVESDLEEEAMKYLSQVVKMPRIAVKAALDAILFHSTQGFDYEALQFSKTCASQDKHEGVAAFLEKRPAQFKGY
jgi:enoyl-CoA hydratase